MLKCNECGTRLDEHEDPSTYVVDTVRCIGCEKIAWEQRSWSDDASAASTYGLKFRLVKSSDMRSS